MLHPALILQPLVSRAGCNGQMLSSVSVALDCMIRLLMLLHERFDPLDPLAAASVLAGLVISLKLVSARRASLQADG